MIDDAGKLAELGKDLAAADVDATTAEMIARVRDQVGRGPSPRRLVLPIAAAIAITAYFAWTVLKLIEVLG